MGDQQRGTYVLLDVKAVSRAHHDNYLRHQFEDVALTEPGKRRTHSGHSCDCAYQPQSSSTRGRATTFSRISSSVAKET